jgi:hypothetical protein
MEHESLDLDHRLTVALSPKRRKKLRLLSAVRNVSSNVMIATLIDVEFERLCRASQGDDMALFHCVEEGVPGDVDKTS